MWIARFAICLFLIAVPSCAALVAGIGDHDFSRIAQVAVCAVCAVLLAITSVLSPRGTAHQPWTKPIVLCLGIICLLALASVFHAPVLSVANRELAMVLGLAGVAAVVATSEHNRQLEWIGVAVVAAASLYGGLSLLSLLISMTQAGPLDRFGITPGYDNYRFFNHTQTAMLPLLAIAASRTFRQGAFSRLAWFAMAMSFALLIFTAGRSTALAVGGAMLLSLVNFGRAALKPVGRLSIGAAAGAVLYVVLFVGLPALVGTSTQGLTADGVAGLQSDHSRFFLWRIALDHMAKEPWLGIGPMHYAHYINPKAAHPHNVYLQVAAEWGVPMLLALLALCAQGAWRLARTIRACANPEQTGIGISLFIAVIAVVVDGMFSGNFVMPVSQMWIAVSIGWAMAWTRINTPQPVACASKSPWRSSRGAWAAIVLLTSQAWLCWSIAPEALDLRTYLSHTRSDMSSSVRRCPRFWSNGWF